MVDVMRRHIRLEGSWWMTYNVEACPGWRLSTIISYVVDASIRWGIMQMPRRDADVCRTAATSFAALATCSSLLPSSLFLSLIGGLRWPLLVSTLEHQSKRYGSMRGPELHGIIRLEIMCSNEIWHHRTRHYGCLPPTSLADQCLICVAVTRRS